MYPNTEQMENQQIYMKLGKVSLWSHLAHLKSALYSVFFFFFNLLSHVLAYDCCVCFMYLGDNTWLEFILDMLYGFPYGNYLASLAMARARFVSHFNENLHTRKHTHTSESQIIERIFGTISKFSTSS